MIIEFSYRFSAFAHLHCAVQHTAATRARDLNLVFHISAISDVALVIIEPTLGRYLGLAHFRALLSVSARSLIAAAGVAVLFIIVVDL